MSLLSNFTRNLFEITLWTNLKLNYITKNRAIKEKCKKSSESYVYGFVQLKIVLQSVVVESEGEQCFLLCTFNFAQRRKKPFNFFRFLSISISTRYVHIYRRGGLKKYYEKWEKEKIWQQCQLLMFVCLWSNCFSLSSFS